jgi:cellulose synthase/poly-beta-1,6-N-acetylglucosamine synthase-like glycosyltransferase
MDQPATVVFLLSVTLLLYVLFGYPLLLFIRSRGGGQAIRKELQRRTVSIVLPVHNGEPWIREKLHSILNLNYPRDLQEIVVISDGSSDRTDEYVRGFESQGVQLIRIPRSGKAAALNAGMERAGGEILFFTDVRQILEKDSLRDLVSCFADPRVGVVSGELVIRSGATRGEEDVGLYWRYEKMIRKRLTRIDSIMGATGAIYAMRRQLAVRLPKNILLDDVYLPLAAFFSGYRLILEENAKAYDYPTSLKVEFRRKVRTLAGVYQIIGAYPALLSPSNRMWLDFISHKLARLLLPYVLLLIAVSSFGLPDPWRTIMLSGQAVFYALAGLDSWIPERFLLKRISSPIRTFVVLVAAAFCAAAILIVPSSTLWKTTRAGSAKPAL